MRKKKPKYVYYEFPGLVGEPSRLQQPYVAPETQRSPKLFFNTGAGSATLSYLALDEQNTWKISYISLYASGARVFGESIRLGTNDPAGPTVVIAGIEEGTKTIVFHPDSMPLIPRGNPLRCEVLLAIGRGYVVEIHLIKVEIK